MLPPERYAQVLTPVCQNVDLRIAHYVHVFKLNGICRLDPNPV